MDHTDLRADSYLEWAFLRWVLKAATTPWIVAAMTAQSVVIVDEHRYRLDYEITGSWLALESSPTATSFAFKPRRELLRPAARERPSGSRLRIVRFSYDAIRRQCSRCVEQLQAALLEDPLLPVT